MLKESAHKKLKPVEFSDECSTHRGHTLDFFCPEHCVLCCSLCAAVGAGHEFCRVCGVGAADMPTARARLRECATTLEACVSAAESFPVEVLEKRAEVAEARAAATKEAIREQFQRIRDAVDRREQELLEAVEEAAATCGSCGGGNWNGIEEAVWGLREVGEEGVGALERVRECEDVWDTTTEAIVTTGTGTCEKSECVKHQKELLWMLSDATAAAKKAERRMQQAVDTLCCETRCGDGGDDDGDGGVEVTGLDERIVDAMNVYGTVRENRKRDSNRNSCGPHMRAGEVTEKSVEVLWEDSVWSGAEVRVWMGTVEDGSSESDMEGRMALVHREPCGGNANSSRCEKMWKAEGLSGGREYVICGEWGVGGVWGRKSPLLRVRTKDGWVWRACPESVYEDLRYAVDPANPKVVTKDKRDWGTVVSDATLEANDVYSWKIKILKTRDFPDGIFIGVAPFDINQNYGSYIWNNVGWYLECFHSSLCAGPPHCFRHKKYGPQNGDKQHIHTGDTIGVVMDTTKAKGELSFVVNDVNLGVAYEGIPLDKPLVPCVLLWSEDSVELIT